VYISTDCGSTWTLLQSYGEDAATPNSWVTGSNNTNVFVPSSASNWCGSGSNASCKTINLNTYAGNDEVRIKFQGKNAFGNNLYLDNININGTPNVKPIANFIGDTAGCTIGNFAYFDVSTNNPTSWNWSMPGASPSTSNQPNPQVTYATGGNYTVTLIASNAAGADTIVQTAFVAIDQALVPTISIAAANASLCAEDTLTLTATTANSGSSASYIWYRNNVFEASTAGPVLKINDAMNGDVFSCVMRPSLSCVTNDSVVSNSVNVNILPLPTVSLTGFPTMCIGSDPITLTGGSPAGGTYSGTGVSNGVFYPQVAGIGGHIITYTIQGANGCYNKALNNISVDNGPPKPTVTYNSLVLKASPISTSYTYQWLDGQGNPIAGATDTIFIPWFTGDYSVQLTFINGCTSQSNPYTVTQVGIDEETLANGIRIFPNPVHDVLHTEFVMNSSSSLNISVVDVAGRLVISEQRNLDAGVQDINLNTSSLPAGIYILELNDGSRSINKRFIKN